MLGGLRVPCLGYVGRVESMDCVLWRSISLGWYLVVLARIERVCFIGLTGLRVCGSTSLNEAIFCGVRVLEERGRGVRGAGRLAHFFSQRFVSNRALYAIFARVRIGPMFLIVFFSGYPSVYLVLTGPSRFLILTTLVKLYDTTWVYDLGCVNLTLNVVTMSCINFAIGTSVRFFMVSRVARLS